MARRLMAAAARALSTGPAQHEVHFHQGATGDPAPCYDARCVRPRLDVAGRRGGS
jgi:hypothetical protein